MHGSPVGLASVALHTLAMYVFVIAAVRLLLGRHTSELSLVDLIVVAVLGSAVETSLINRDVSLQAGLVSAATLLIANRAVSLLLKRFRRLHRLMFGRPIAVAYNGRLLSSRVRRAGLTEEDVLAGIRERGFDRLDQVRLATLEIDGMISVIPRDDPGKHGKHPR